METKRQCILIVEDEPTTRTLMTKLLQDQGFETKVAASEKQMTAILTRWPIDLVLLDLNLPDKHGLTILGELRASSDIKVIIVSVQDTNHDKVLGLEQGADDYIAKPFDGMELVARIRANLRRPSQALSTPQHPMEYHFDGWTLNTTKRILLDPEGMPVVLTSGEYDLLHFFICKPGQVLNRDQLIQAVSPHQTENHPFDRTVDVMVGRLRGKLEKNRDSNRLFVTVRNAGYMFVGMVT